VSEPLERGVAIGPGGIGGEQLYPSNRRFFAETATPWVRMWADWPVLQPDADTPPDRGRGAQALARLDDGIARARADGLRVILTAWRFPRWANGSAALGAAEPTHRLEDRIDRDADPARRKDLTFKLPRDLSPSSDWARWIDFLLTRYGGRGPRSVDALELLNEPNLQLWPQRAPSPDAGDPYASGALTIDDAVARMMVTAQRVARRHGDRAPLLVAPATADPAGDSRLRTAFDTFTRALLDRLAERGFDPGPRFAWSHHSYADVEGDLGGADNRVASVRRMLAGRWAGWPDGDAAAPALLVTESGARLDKVAKDYALGDAGAAREKQAELLERNWRRMQLAPEGEGVRLLCLYLFVTDMNYDSGLCDLDGTPRPAYHAWARLPGAG
jgi:hypothetical protein